MAARAPRPPHPGDTPGRLEKSVQDPQGGRCARPRCPRQRVTVSGGDKVKPVNEDGPALTWPLAVHGGQGGSPQLPHCQVPVRDGPVELDPAGSPFPTLSNEKDRLRLMCLACGGRPRADKDVTQAVGRSPGEPREYMSLAHRGQQARPERASLVLMTFSAGTRDHEDHLVGCCWGRGDREAKAGR